MSKKYLNIFLVFISILFVATLNVVSTADQSCRYHAPAYEGLELTQLSQELQHTGLIGRIHGAAANTQLFVLSVRQPDNFFNHREFSLLARDEPTRTMLAQANRHDLVCIQGDLADNPSPQPHVLIKSIKILDAWSGLKHWPPYPRSQELLPPELVNQTQLIGKVHAIGAAGQILVVEYQDRMFPIFVEATEHTQGLFRGDIIRLNYQIQARPQQPPHLRLDLESKTPIAVIDAIATWHQQQKTLTGKLVKFPQSPQLKFDVYAIEVETQGIKRTFTLVNFDDPNTFQRIREKLAALWDSHVETAVSGRNMLINPAVTIVANGQLNVVSPEQANPQIWLKSAADIQLKSPDV